jgi:hypothetical protein
MAKRERSTRNQRIVLLGRVTAVLVVLGTSSSSSSTTLPKTSTTFGASAFSVPSSSPSLQAIRSRKRRSCSRIRTTTTLRRWVVDGPNARSKWVGPFPRLGSTSREEEDLEEVDVWHLNATPPHQHVQQCAADSLIDPSPFIPTSTIGDESLEEHQRQQSREGDDNIDVAVRKNDGGDGTFSSSNNNKSLSWNQQNLMITVPALMGLMADPFLSMVDTGFVGQTGGVVDLAALGVCTSIFHMCFSIFRGSTAATIGLMHSAAAGTTTTTTTTTTHSIRQQQRHIAKISLQFAGVLGTLVWLGLSFLGGGTWLLSLMGVGPDSPLFQPACRYLYARAWAAPAVVGST